MNIIFLFFSIFWIMNLISFCLYFIDKRRAIKDKHRISEKTLLMYSLFFGSVGAVFGMYFFRHKTKKIKFRILVVLFLILHMVILYKIAFSFHYVLNFNY